MGLNGETCYCLITDYYSGTLHGEVFHNKSPPVDFINRWLSLYALGPEVPNKYVHLDLGGELGHSEEIIKLFENAGYVIEGTAGASSHQNGPGERPHQCCNKMSITMMVVFVQYSFLID
jgi:hypothetical protein